MAQVETPGKNSTQEYALLELVTRLERHREGRIAVQIHLSRLAPHNRREQYIRLAFSTFDNAIGQGEGQTFLLRSNDIVFIGPAGSAQFAEQAVSRLRYLFSEDALTQRSEDGRETGFCTRYALDRDYQKLHDVCCRIYQLSQAKLAPSVAAGGPQRTPINPKSLAKLEELLVGTDLSNLIRNQPVCALGEGLRPSILFHEMYVSIAELEASLMPLVQITSNPWLFRYLTQCLDKRMLAHLSREWGQDRSFSINLNVSTLLSSEFLKFDHQISSTARGRLVIEVQKVDIFDDMGAYLFARDYARERGYRLCLDGMTHLTLPFIDCEKLGLDLVKLLWSPELAAVENAKQLDNLRACIDAVGASRMILAHCDSEDAVRVGRSLGIGLFQGRLLSKLAVQHGRAATAPAKAPA